MEGGEPLIFQYFFQAFSSLSFVAYISGYTGVNCTSDIDECKSSPCLHGGNCTHGINFYNCTCPARYTGANCEVDTVDDCVGHPCQNNASCVDGVNHFNCTCVPGFEGPRSVTAHKILNLT